MADTNISGPVILGEKVNNDTKSTALLLQGGEAQTASQAGYESTSTAGKNFVEFRTKSTATSGDSRGAYLRHYISGAGGNGECARIYTTVDAAAANAHGAHITCSLGSSAGYITGEAIAVRAQLQVPNRAVDANGTYSALNAEIYLDGTDADLSATTQHSLIRGVVAGGDATARQKVLNLLSIEGVTTATGKMVETGVNEPTWTSKTVKVRCLLNGTPFYLIGVLP